MTENLQSTKNLFNYVFFITCLLREEIIFQSLKIELLYSVPINHENSDVRIPRSFPYLSFSAIIPIGPVAQWITRLTTDQKIPGSTPGRLEIFITPRAT